MIYSKMWHYAPVSGCQADSKEAFTTTRSYSSNDIEYMRLRETESGIGRRIEEQKAPRPIRVWLVSRD